MFPNKKEICLKKTLAKVHVQKECASTIVIKSTSISNFQPPPHQKFLHSPLKELQLTDF